MIVFIFWMGHWVSRLQSLYVLLWPPCCRDCTQDLALVCFWWIQGLPFPFVYFSFLQAGWGALRPVCNKCPNVKDSLNGINVFAFPFAQSMLQCYCQLLKLFWTLFPLPCLPLFIVLLTCWVSTVTFKFLPTMLLLIRILIVLVVDLLLIFVRLWWQVTGIFPHILLPLSRRLFSHLCLDQHGFMLWLHLRMHVHPLFGGWFKFCLLTVLDDHSVSKSGQPLIKHSFSSLLSLSLACKYAQEHGSFCTCCCWHLVCLPQARDEVKRECPIVYDECLSETALASLATLVSLAEFSVTLLGGTALIITTILLLYWNCLSLISRLNHVFIGKLICITGHITHGLLFGQLLFMGKNQRDQHVNMLRMHPWMTDHPLLGGRTIFWLYFFYETASLIADLSLSVSVLPVSWTFSYLLLSLNLVCKFAHKFVGLPTGWCWHLGLMLSCRDEVKEKCSFVNEETFSETKSSLPNLLWTMLGCPAANEDDLSEKQSSLPMLLWTVFGWRSQAAFQMLLHVIPLWCQLKLFPQDYAATLDVKLTLLSVISFGSLFIWNCCIQDWFSWAYYIALVLVLCIKGLVDHLHYPRCFLRRSGKNLPLYFIFQ